MTSAAVTDSVGAPIVTDGHRVIGFIQTFCRYTKGPLAGQLIVLRPWQVELILELYRLDPATMRRVYRRGLWGVAKKNGKTMMGAALALYALIADGETGAEVYSVAGDRDQARICFDDAMAMVRLEPELAAVCRVRDNQATILHLASGSTYRAISADAPTADGYNPSFVVFDEVHVQPNAKLWEVMTQGTGTRTKAMVLGITTAGYDLNTLCGRLYKMGKSAKKPSGFAFKWYEPADPLCDYRDERVWYEANPGLGDFQLIEDFRQAAAEAAERGGESAFYRYRLNMWRGSVESWLAFGLWAKLAHPELKLTEREPVVLGFDGSFNGDSTALVAVTTGRETPHVQVIEAWERPEGIDGQDWQVPITEVEARIVKACEEYAVREVACDPFRWQRSMQVLTDAGVPISAFTTGSPARMVPATTLFSDMVRDGLLTQDGDPRLADHIANAKIKRDQRGPRIVKDTTAKHIDLAVAAIVALERATIGKDVEPEPIGEIW